jgi:hypothetical protein
MIRVELPDPGYVRIERKLFATLAMEARLNNLKVIMPIGLRCSEVLDGVQLGRAGDGPVCTD